LFTNNDCVIETGFFGEPEGVWVNFLQCARDFSEKSPSDQVLIASNL